MNLIMCLLTCLLMILQVLDHKKNGVLPEILISNSDGEEEANDVRNKVIENKIDDSVSSKLVVVSQKFPFNLNETHCNLDATIPCTPSMTTLVSSEGTSDLVTTLSAISSGVLREENIENSKYNLEVAPVCCFFFAVCLRYGSQNRKHNS